MRVFEKKILVRPQSLKGVAGDVIILEEAAYCDPGLVSEVIIPLLTMQSSCLLCISTLLAGDNHYSKMFELRDETTNEPLFDTMQISLVCEACLQTEHPELCTHKLAECAASQSNPFKSLFLVGKRRGVWCLQDAAVAVVEKARNRQELAAGRPRDAAPRVDGRGRRLHAARVQFEGHRGVHEAPACGTREVSARSSIVHDRTAHHAGRGPVGRRSV